MVLSRKKGPLILLSVKFLRIHVLKHHIYTTVYNIQNTYFIHIQYTGSAILFYRSVSFSLFLSFSLSLSLARALSLFLSLRTLAFLGNEVTDGQADQHAPDKELGLTPKP